MVIIAKEAVVFSCTCTMGKFSLEGAEDFVEDKGGKKWAEGASLCKTFRL